MEDNVPLGTNFESYNLTKAINHWTLDPYQYQITKFDFNGKKQQPVEGGLKYQNTNFEKLLPRYTSVSRSANDLRAQDYHRFQANEGYFDQSESTRELWYDGADRNNGVALNVQEPNHIIFPEPQRGGLGSRNLVKYSWTSTQPLKTDLSWETTNQRNPFQPDCQVFNFNSRKDVDFNKVYSFDSTYCRNIGISGKNEGTMPFLN